MTTIGIIGGIAPESTIDYYRLLISVYQAQRPDGSSPSILINSIDLTRMLAFVTSNDLEGLAAYLEAEIRRLADAGAACGALASNTPHIVFDELERRSPIPLISIVRSALDAAARLGARRLALLGTRFTMLGRFYPEVFAAKGIDLVVPDAGEITFVHEKYMNELVKGSFLPSTRDGIMAIVDRMKKRDGIDGVILAGTELPLLLRDARIDGLHMLDTTRLHVEAIVARMLLTEPRRAS